MSMDNSQNLTPEKELNDEIRNVYNSTGSQTKTDINTVTNDLLLKYDRKFNELYNVKLKLNSSITNKEELITQMNNNNVHNDLIIAVLKWLLSVLIVLLILCILYKYKVFSLFTLSLLFILIIIVYIFYGYNIYKTYSLNMFDKQIKTMKVGMNNYLTELKNTIDSEEGGLTCPKDCPAVLPKEEISSLFSIRPYNNETLKTDSQLDVWKHGDIPEDLWPNANLNFKNFNPNMKNVNEQKDFKTVIDPLFNQKFNNYDINSFGISNPKSRFGTTSPSMTYYKCDWMGGEFGNNFPLKSNLTYSSIPCDYKPNYTESGRYICKTNPNNLSSSSNLSDICDDVSYKG